MVIFGEISSKLSRMTGTNVRWAFNISKWNPTPEEMVKCTTYIQQEEKERLGRFYFKSDFKSSLVGRLLMRKFIAETTNIAYNGIMFSRDDKGKPILVKPNLEAIKFNISHQGDFVVLAGSDENISIGVDVMKLDYKGGKSLSEFFRIMNKQFSQQEWETIKCGTEREQISMFYRLWCLKEGYVKAIGVGITMNLQSISFRIITKKLELNKIVSDTQLYLEGEKQDWEFHEMLLDENHCVAVAMNGLNNKKIIFRELCVEQLIKDGIPILDEDLDYCNNYFKKPDKS